MPTLLIAYDLANPVATKPDLVAEIMAIGEAWARPLDTVWYVRTDLTAAAVTDALAPLIGADDGLVVQPAPIDAGLANTSLRWFRPRRSQQRAAADIAGNVVSLRHDRRAPADASDLVVALRAAS